MLSNVDIRLLEPCISPIVFQGHQFATTPVNWPKKVSADTLASTCVMACECKHPIACSRGATTYLRQI